MSHRRVALAIVSAAVLVPAGAGAQQTSVWLDASASHARPPANVVADAASYGLLGARLRLDAPRGGNFELGAHFGRGAETASGSWGSGSVAGEIARVAGVLSYGARADAFGLRYFSALQADDSSIKQAVAAGSVRPSLGLSAAGFLMRVEGAFTRGGWRLESSNGLLPTGPGGLLGGGGPRDVGDTTITGDIAVTGATASLTRMLGAATFQLEAERMRGVNQIHQAGGIYEGAAATLGWGAGSVDFSVGLRAQRSPDVGDATRSELGFHAGVGAALGQAGYAHFSLARSVADPMYGTAGSVGATLGLSFRVGGGAADRAPAARVGAASSDGRRVTFRLRERAASRVAVAGDFNNWQPREMRRQGDDWQVELVLPAGVHHYSFVIDGERWHVPDDAAGVVDDGFGRKNATVVVPD